MLVFISWVPFFSTFSSCLLYLLFNCLNEFLFFLIFIFHYICYIIDDGNFLYSWLWIFTFFFPFIFFSHDFRSVTHSLTTFQPACGTALNSRNKTENKNLMNIYRTHWNHQAFLISTYNINTHTHRHIYAWKTHIHLALLSAHTKTNTRTPRNSPLWHTKFTNEG